MSEERKKVFISGVEYEEESTGQVETLSRTDHKSNMRVVHVFSSNPDSGRRMEAFKRSVASFLFKTN